MYYLMTFGEFITAPFEWVFYLITLPFKLIGFIFNAFLSLISFILSIILFFFKLAIAIAILAILIYGAMALKNKYFSRRISNEEIRASADRFDREKD